MNNPLTPLTGCIKNLFIIGLVALIGTGVKAGTIKVCPDCEIRSIREAINVSQYCDTLIVGPGTYSEGRIIINKSLTLIGNGFPVIDGSNSSEIFTVTADHVHIEGFQIQNVGTSYMEDRAGIRIQKSAHFTIIRNKLINTFFGIYLENADHGIVKDNILRGEAVDEMSSGNAIHLWHCKHILVEGNEVSHHRDGIYFEFVDSSLIKNNRSSDNIRYGLHFMFSNDDDYHNNTFKRNGAGVAVMFSRRINMWENLFENNWGSSAYGILLKEIYDTRIYNNVFRQNTIGIYAEGSTRIDYKKNDFIRNGWAIKISGGCLDNHVNKNNFISNSFDLAIRSSSIENDFHGNYWSEYTGYDLDRDGIGDVPYRPVKLFNYIVNNTPEAMVLLRSFFVDIVNFAEKVSPIFTPAKVFDARPSMDKILTAQIDQSFDRQ